MFSGKTTELIRRMDALASAGRRAILIKPAADQRYSQAEIVTHTGARRPAIQVESADQVEPAVLAATEALPRHADGAGHIVGIDEAHFFGAALAGVCERLLAVGATVIVAGLERDHRGRPFEPFPSLLCEADEVVKLTGPCAVCGMPAVHSQRMVSGEGRIVVGGAESYQPRCRDCFLV